MKTSLLRFTLRCLLIVAALCSANLALADDIWIDVRSDAEWQAGHLEGAQHIPHTEISDKIAALTQDKNASIKLYCRSGGRAGMAKKALEELGYTNVENIGSLEDAQQAVKKD